MLSLSANAEMAGTVTHLSGPLLAKKADGTSMVLSQKSIVESGDLLVTEKDTYARIKFTDNSEITLKPNTQIKIDAYLFDRAKPEADSAVFNLIKGGLRALTGLVGKRGNQDSYQLKAPSATIGIRGTDYIAEYLPPDQSHIAAYRAASLAAIASDRYVQGNSALADAPISDAPQDFLPEGALELLQLAQPPPAGSDGRNPGLYVQVLDGTIHVTNGGGTQNFTAGQFGYTASFTQPPVILPANPGIQFTPPPSFSSNAGSQGGKGGGKPGGVDCVVR
jgi:hypothetical protein